MNQESIQQILSIFDSKEGEFTEEIQPLKNAEIQKKEVQIQLKKTRKQSNMRKKNKKEPKLDEIIIHLLTPKEDENQKIWKTTEQLIEECQEHDNAPGMYKDISLNQRVKANLRELSYLKEVEFDQSKNQWSLYSKDKDKIIKRKKI